MPAIGYVRRTGKGFEGNLNTPSIKSKVTIVTNAGKTNEGQPDYLVFVDGAEVGGQNDGDVFAIIWNPID